MILCVTLNPCLDKTLTVPAWKPGDNVRGTSVREVVGGKGNNVARALARLGRQARPVTFLGGTIGDYCELLLRRDDGLDPIITPTNADTRVILTVRGGDNEPTAFFDPDPAITDAEASDLLHRVEGALAAGGVTALTMSGSSPSPSTHELYSELIALARARRIPTFLDTYGPPLDTIWAFWPDAITLNRREASLYLKTPDATESDLRAMLARWSSRGVKVGIVTDGPGPVVANLGGKPYLATPPTIDAVNPIGSGDCLLAGLVDATLRGDDPETRLKHAIGAAVVNASVWDAGAIDPDSVARMADRVTIV
jgi:tagatose 6-phosphate kinase